MLRSWTKDHIRKGGFTSFSAVLQLETNLTALQEALLGNGDQSHDCSLVFQPLAVVCSRCRTNAEGRASMRGGFTQGPFPPSDKWARAVREDHNTESDRVHPSAHPSKEAFESAPGLRRTWARLASASHNRCRSRRPRYRVVLFSPILDVLHAFWSTCCCTTSNAPQLSMERFSDSLYRDLERPGTIFTQLIWSVTFIWKKHLECFAVDACRWKESVEWMNANVSFYVLKRF